MIVAIKIGMVIWSRMVMCKLLFLENEYGPDKE